MILGLAGLCAFQFSHAAVTLREYTLNRDAQKYLWGTGKKESYDIAIRLSDPGLQGMKIKKISVLLPEAFIPINIKGWLTSELALDSEGCNVADIVTSDGYISDGMLIVEFPEAVAIPKGGLYVGYSFGMEKFDDVAKYPVAVGQGIKPDGFYLHTSRTNLQWKDEAAHCQVYSDMVITLEWDYKDYSVGICDMTESFLKPDSEGNICVGLVNHGLKTPSVISYTVKFANGNVYESSYVPTEPLLPFLDAVKKVELPVVTPGTTGTNDITVSVTSVENVANQDAGASAEGPLTIMAFEPQRRVLMEEYTGLWCGACPRGYVALEEMHLRDPKDFVAVSYHNSDLMSTLHSSEYPNNVEGFPSAFLNRTAKVDAYYGDTEGVPMGIEQTLANYKSMFTPGNIDVNVRFKDYENGIIEAESKTKFVFDRGNADYSVAYILVGDNLHKDSWIQTSYYTNEPDLVDECSLWEPFVNNDKVAGLIFNDIFLTSPAVKGSENSLPSSIISNTEYSHKYEFNTKEIVNLYGKEFMNDDVVFRVVVALIDNATGEVINCATSSQIHSGVNAPEAENPIVRVEYFDLNGYLVESPQSGMYICRKTHTDGSFDISKIVIRMNK